MDGCGKQKNRKRSSIRDLFTLAKMENPLFPWRTWPGPEKRGFCFMPGAGHVHPVPVFSAPDANVMNICLSESLPAAHDQKGHHGRIDQIQQVK